MSLRGITVAITSSRRAFELANIVRKFGGVPYIAPTIGIINNIPLISQSNRFIETIVQENIHFFIFMTGVGVFNLFQNLKDSHQIDNVIERLRDTIVIARSNKPSMELRKFGIATNFVPNMNTLEGVLDLIRKFDLKNKNIGILWHGDYSDLFKRKLESLGSKVFEFSSYSYSTNLEQKNAAILKEMGYDYVAPSNEKIKRLIDDIVAGNIDTITFTSPPAVKEFFEFASRNNKIDLLIDKLNHNVLVVSVGPSTSAMIEKFRIKVDFVPHAYRMGTMVKELADYISSHE
ncbi:MAG TPA: uroporphyrinogen-III synthase [Nitrososphaeraceae archaeon]|nr:uroporphyrinogen-III synthase [Nitrososphaeraceae archaeon]